MPDTDHIIADGERQVMRCLVCGDEAPLPIGPMRWFVTVTGAFIKEHRSKAHLPRGCRFSTPIPAKDTPANG